MNISNVTSTAAGAYPVAAAGTQESGRGGGKPAQGSQTITDEQQRQVEELKKRDTEVKAHEAAHVAAGGQYVRGGASYTYQSGPDGKRYAVGGEVSIDVSPVSGDPAATVAKMRTIKRAAMAPANPSGADQAVAAAATSAEIKAQQELMEKRSGKGSAIYSPDEKPAEKHIADKKSESPFVFSKIATNIYAGNSFMISKNSVQTINQIIDLIA